MRPRRRALLVLALAIGACRVGQAPPYAPGAGPTPATLLAATAPASGAVRVPDATLRIRGVRASLGLLIEPPGRLRGRVQKSGIELATVVVRERGYELRYLMDAHPQGFYSGPPSTCAIAALLGVDLGASDLVSIVLGGAPLPPEPRRIVADGWDRRRGVERLRIEHGSVVEEIRFGFHGGAWRVVGATRWDRGPGGTPTPSWSFDHEGVRAHGGVAERTRLVAGHGPPLLVSWGKVEPAPALAPVEPPSGSDDGGWEDEEGAAAAAGETPPPAPTPSSAPDPFDLEPEGLTIRGDLCRSRGAAGR